ncbi:hypothetical protein [Paraburkholderia terrae]|uniref:hypothetical protein n=1 Tax=Paraburkholderia terrae TaxID=311230 RepID=UPI0005A992D9|nr:hypothetical protein [Paraburkholderia terrae]
MTDHAIGIITTYVRNVGRVTDVAIGPVGDLYLVNGPEVIRLDHDTLKTQTVVDALEISEQTEI